MHQLGFPTVFMDLPSALFAAVALAAFPMAVLTALSLIFCFRRAVARSMAASAGAAKTVEGAISTAYVSAGEIVIDRIDMGSARTATQAGPLLARICQARARAAWHYVIATGSCSLVLALLFTIRSGFSPDDAGILITAILILSSTFMLATPVVMATTVVLSRQVSAMLLAVLLQLIAIWTGGCLFGTGSIGLWAMIAGTPTAAILLLSTRRLRAVGPIVYVAWIMLLFPIIMGQTYATLRLLDRIGPISFVREDLARLPFLDAVERFLGDLLKQPTSQTNATIADIASDPLSMIKIANPDGLPPAAGLWLFGIAITSALVGGFAAWAFMRWLGRSYRRRRASDQMLTIDVIMIVFNLPIVLIFIWMGAPALALFAVFGFLCYWIPAHRLGRRPQATAAPLGPRSLLLLRVFGFDRRTQGLLDDFAQWWRYLGPIHLIAGPDAAYSTIEPYEFFEFLAGRLSRAFVKGPEDLERRLAASSPTPDPDGLFRIEDFFCHEDTWRMTVARLARESDAVLMDLRGFGPANRGCVYEIEQLLAIVAVGRIALLTDRSTDQPFLEATLRQAWRAMPAHSPNAGPVPRRLKVLDVSSGNRRMVQGALAVLCESLGERGPSKVSPIGRAIRAGCSPVV